MSIFNQFPWTNFREYNLDWVIRTVKKCQEDVEATTDDIADLQSRMTAAEGSITNLQGRMTTVEGYESRIAALEALQPKRVILRYDGADWSYGTGDFAAVESIMNGMLASGTTPSLDLLGSIVYMPTVSSPAYTLHSAKFNSSYGVGKPAYDLTFDNGDVSVTVKWDGTFA